MMVSPTAAEAAGADFGLNPVGSGPFRFVEWRTGDRLVVEKNPDYWQDGKPYLDGITFRYISDATTVVNGLRTHEFDVALKLPAAEVETLDVPDLDIEVHPSLSTELCYFNFSRPPFDDPQVRRAASLAIDREALNGAHRLRPGADRRARCSRPATGRPIRRSPTRSRSTSTRPAN